MKYKPCTEYDEIEKEGCMNVKNIFLHIIIVSVIIAIVMFTVIRERKEYRNLEQLYRVSESNRTILFNKYQQNVQYTLQLSEQLRIATNFVTASIEYTGTIAGDLRTAIEFNNRTWERLVKSSEYRERLKQLLRHTNR